MDSAEEKSKRPGARDVPAPGSSASPPHLPEDPKQAEEAYNALSTDAQLGLFFKARGKGRLRYLFLSRNPEPLVHHLPELDLFLTVKEVGEKDAFPLLSLTTPEQFQFVLDLDCWKKDRLDRGSILHWIEILLESGEKKIAQFVQSTDLEFLALLFKKFLRVTTHEGEPAEAGEKNALFTLDQYYFVSFKGKGSREVLEPLLKIFSLIDGEGYRRLMESLIWELESDLEETGYRQRNARLAEFGFPGFEEALGIYRFIDPNSLLIKKSLPSTEEKKVREKDNPSFYLNFREEGPFFSSIVKKIEDREEQDRLAIELTTLCNRALVAEPADPSSLEEIERITKKVLHYLNLGLQYVSQRDETKALEVLQGLALEKLFQCGISLTLLLKRKAEAILKGPWFAGDRGNLVSLDSHYLERFEGVLNKRPSLNRNGIVKDFESLEEIEETSNLLEIAETVSDTLRSQLNLTPRDLKNLNLNDCYPQSWQEITLSTLLLTGLANQVLRGSFRFEPIEKVQLSPLFSRFFERNEKGKGAIRMEIRDKLKEWCNLVEQDEDKRRQLHAFRDFCLDLLEEEARNIPAGEQIDPRFVKGLLICK